MNVKMVTNVKIKKLNDDAIIPKKAHPTDAGFDLVAISKEWDKDNECWSYGTGLAIEIPKGWVGLLFPRSSIFKTGMILSNHVGVIDSAYRGEIMLKFRQLSAYKPEYSIGDRVGQLILIPYPEINLVESDTLSDSDRGEGGFGSSGK